MNTTTLKNIQQLYNKSFAILWAGGVWKCVYPRFLGAPNKSPNNFFSFYKKSRGQTEKRWGKEKGRMTKIVATNVVASQPPDIQ